MKIGELYTDIRVNGASQAQASIHGVAGAFAVGNIAASIFFSALRAGERALRFIVSEGINAESSMFRLGAMLRITGQGGAAMAADMARHADALEAITRVDDDVIKENFRLAMSFGASAEGAVQATQMALGLSEAFGLDLATATRGVTMAMEGEFGMLSRYLPQVRTATTETEKWAAIQKAANEGLALAAESGYTAAGSWQALKVAAGNLAEELGTRVNPYLTATMHLLKNIFFGYKPPPFMPTEGADKKENPEVALKRMLVELNGQARMMEAIGQSGADIYLAKSQALSVEIQLADLQGNMLQKREKQLEFDRLEAEYKHKQVTDVAAILRTEYERTKEAKAQADALLMQKERAEALGWYEAERARRTEEVAVIEAQISGMKEFAKERRTTASYSGVAELSRTMQLAISGAQQDKAVQVAEEEVKRLEKIADILREGINVNKELFGLGE